jgi:hypothetical protein
VLQARRLRIDQNRQAFELAIRPGDVRARHKLAQHAEATGLFQRLDHDVFVTSGRSRCGSIPPCRWRPSRDGAISGVAIEKIELVGSRLHAACSAPPTGRVQPTRASVSTKVDRGMLNVRQTDAFVAPFSRAAMIWSIFSWSIARGRPPLLPRRRAA